MKKVLCMAAVAALVAVSSVSAQTVLTIGLVDGGDGTYDVTGVLSGDPSQGLALWGVDVNSDVMGIAALTPGAAMSSFVKNDGLTNPAGYGGTASGDYDLLQVGGGQNTINNNVGNAPYPIGAVVTGITDTILAEGVCADGETITLANGFANVIDSAAMSPVYAVNAADIVLGGPITCAIGGGCATLIGVKSFGTHAGGQGDLSLDIGVGGSLVEPRVQGGGQLWIELEFDDDVAPGDYTSNMPGATIVAGADSTKLNMVFAANVADGGYAVDISCGAKAIIGSFCIVYLSADVDGGGVVAGLDNAAVSASWGAAAASSVSATRADVDRSGVVAGLDNAAISANWGGSASCP